MWRGVPDLSDAPPGLYGLAVSDVPLVAGTVVEATARPGLATVRLDDGREVACWFGPRLLRDFFFAPALFRVLEGLAGARAWVEFRPGSGPEVTQVAPTCHPDREEGS
jgi:hypothetical protein